MGTARRLVVLMTGLIVTMTWVQGAAAAAAPADPPERVRAERTFAETRFIYSRAATRDVHAFLDTHDAPETLVNGSAAVGCSLVGAPYAPVCAVQATMIAFDYSRLKDQATEAADSGRCLVLVAPHNLRADSLPFTSIVGDGRCFG